MAAQPEDATREKHACIEDIRIRPRADNFTLSKSLDVTIDEAPQKPVYNSTVGQTIRWSFDPSFVVSSKSRFVLQPYRVQMALIPCKMELIQVPVADLIQQCPTEPEKIAEWQKTYPRFELIIRVSLATDSQLPPKTDEVFLLCPRFRILVIGRSGVGKSSLINKTFGVNDALVSHHTAGESDINRQILSNQNERFVLHDSKGFEPGDEVNFCKVQSFVEDRHAMPELKDQLHAIWLCIETPSAGSRVLEKGDENSIKLFKHVPIIVVFTKYDRLVETMKRNMEDSRVQKLSPTEVHTLARKLADAEFKKIVSVLKRASNKAHYVKVSTQDEYSATLSDLTYLTYDLVRKCFTSDNAAIVSATAQRGSSDPKIVASIIVGKKKYWRGLASSANFPGKSLKNCLDVIHRDIIAIWNYDDLNQHLLSDNFKALVSNTDRPSEPGRLGPMTAAAAAMSAGGGLLGAVGGIAGPAAPIIIPIVACFIIAYWAYSIYSQSREVLQHLMMYIVDLTIIMENLFWLKFGDSQPVTRRAVKLAFMAYYDSTSKVQIHEEIAEYTQATNIFDRSRRDDAIEKIKSLIYSHRSNQSKMIELRARLRGNDEGSADEPWDPSSN